MFALCGSVLADVKPNSLFNDNAVLQRDCVAPIWGTARDGEKITVEFTGQKVSTVAKDGKWMVRLKPLQAGGPFTMTIAGDITITLTNILVGDIWVASGQSNMERPLRACSWAPPIDNWQAEVAAANYRQLRQFYVPENMAYSPVADANGNWMVCSPKTAPDFSAVGYFFGRDLQQAIKVPVGILFSTWGGTVAEAWTSANSLKKVPDFTEALSTVHEMAANNNCDTNKYEQLLDEWYRQNDPASTAQPAWSATDLGASKWKEINLPTQWDYVGVVWFRKEINLPESWVGKNAILHLGPIDDQDTTWMNGVRVGSMHKWDDVRNYSVPSSVLKAGRNVIVVRMLNTGGVGGIDGKSEQMKLEVPEDNQSPSIPLAGAWQYLDSVPLTKTSPVPQNPANNPNVPTVLFNAMIAPLQSYPIKGVIWYQGEANNDRAKQYQILFPLLIDDWRKQWHEGHFPFLFVQIAPFCGMTPEIREAQFLTLKQSPNTAMVVITDAGDANDIHPSHKQVVGERLALAARGLAYAEKIEYSGPLFDSMRIENSRAILSFTHAGSGLVTKGGELKGFTLAGEDKTFVPAHAEIQGDEIVVTSDQVAKPVAVRYGWANVPDVNLYNKEGLPASPFRTDLNTTQ